MSGIAGSATEHDKIEARDPTQQEYNTMSDQIRVLFAETYGQEAYATSVLEKDRINTEARRKKGEIRIGF